MVTQRDCAMQIMIVEICVTAVGLRVAIVGARVLCDDCASASLARSSASSVHTCCASAPHSSQPSVVASDSSWARAWALSEACV